MDKVDIIGWLQVMNTTDWMQIHERVNNAMENLIQDYYQIIETSNDSLDISPLDYYQWTNWVLVKKTSANEVVNKYRIETYNFLCVQLWKDIVNNFIFVINSSSSSKYLDDMLKNITDIWVLEMIKVLVCIESKLVWKLDMYVWYLDHIYDNWIYPESSKILWIILFEYHYYDVSYEYLSKLKDIDAVWNDIDLLYSFIMLNKILNKNEDAFLFLNKLSTFIDESFENWDIKDIDLKEYMIFIYQWYLDYYILTDSDFDELISCADVAISFWIDAYYHIIYWYLQKWDVLNATNYYNKWRWFRKNKKSFLAKNPIKTLEEFYLFWAENAIYWSTELLLKFYREEFENNWYNEEYFDNMLFFVLDEWYEFSQKDNILFEEFNKYYESQDNDKKVVDLVEELFMKYSETTFALYLDKILIIISKMLRWKYKNINKVKKAVTVWFENLALMDDKSVSDKEYFEVLKNKVLLLSDNDYLDSRFDELIIKFCIHISWFIETYSTSKMQITTSLASIFDYYWYAFVNYKELAFENDMFFKENHQNKKALSLH